MRTLSKISLLLLIAAFALSSTVSAKDDKDKGKRTPGQRTYTRSLGTGKIGACSTGSATVDLDQNNVRARLYNNGHLFWKGSGNVYTVPKSGAANALFASGIWIGGLVGTEFRFAGTDYGPFEFFPGPLDETGAPPTDCSVYDRIYSVTRSDVADYEAGLPHSSDLEEWPWQLGAPILDGDGNPNNYNLAGGDRPQIIGEQTAWWVMNDAGGTKDWSKTSPLGLEVQVTAFAFRTADALNNTTFYKYKLIYKGTQQLHDAYFGIWSDPDLGNATDDYVASDTTLGLGIIYNGDGFDDGSDGYGGAPPALAYDYFQGPLVNNDGIDNDNDGQVDESASDGQDNDGDGETDERDEDERIAMSRFVYYNNDNGVQGNPDGESDDPYNYLRGIWRDGSPMTFGGSGYGGDTRTNFMFPGDPVSKAFWSEFNTDGNNSSNTPADRRFLMSSGPFTMNPGDVQEIVYGIVWSQAAGTEPNLSSVAKLKADDALAQAAFDVDFELPSPPDAPRVTAAAYDETVTLTWVYRPSDNNFADSYDVLNPFLADVPDEVAPDKTYSFEGFKIYRYDSAGDQTPELIATYDVENDVTVVTDVGFDEATGVPITVVTARGTDSGISHNFTIASLTNYTEYHFGVQAYAYNEFSSPKVLEGPITRVAVTPTRVDSRAGGTAIATSAIEARRAAADTLGFDLLGAQTGVGDGSAGAMIVDPTSLTGHNYEVRFVRVVDDTDPDHPIPLITYNIVDVTTGEVKLSGEEYFNRTGQVLPQRNNVAVIDGLEFSVAGPPPGIDRFYVTANASGPLNPPDMGTFAFNSNGFPTVDALEVHCTAQSPVIDYAACNDRPSEQQQVGPAEWGINVGGGTGTYASFLERSIRNDNIERIGAYDYEIRFTEAGGYGWAAFTDGAAIKVPFELWRTGVGTPDDPSDDLRMIPYINDVGTAHEFSLSGDHPVSGGDNDPITDWIYWELPAVETPGDASYRAFEQAMLTDPENYEGDHEAGEVFARMVLVNFNGGVLPDVNAPMPETGTVFRITTAKPNQPGDVFAFNTQDIGVQTGQQQVAVNALDLIGIVPNPYKGGSVYEISVTDDEVKFTNIGGEANVRVYTLSGVLVWEAKLGGNNNRWDLKTSEGLPLASGMYLVHVEVPGVGEKVIKFGCIKKRIQLDLL